MELLEASIAVLSESIYSNVCCMRSSSSLVPGYLDGVTGIYQTPAGYYVKDGDVEEFDKGFPPKEKLKLPGQIFD